jgi:hypothetical protein
MRALARLLARSRVLGKWPTSRCGSDLGRGKSEGLRLPPVAAPGVQLKQDPPVPDSKTTVGAPSPVPWMCIRLLLNRTSCPGGGKRRRSRHVSIAWYAAPAAGRASVPRITTRVTIAIGMEYPEPGMGDSMIFSTVPGVVVLEHLVHNFPSEGWGPRARERR